MFGLKTVTDKRVLKRLGGVFVLLGSTLFVLQVDDHILGISLIMLLATALGFSSMFGVNSSTLRLQIGLGSTLLLVSSLATVTPLLSLEPSHLFVRLTSFLVVVLILMIAFDHLIEGLNALVMNRSLGGNLLVNSVAMLILTYLLFLDFAETTPDQMIAFLRLKFILLGGSMLSFNHAVIGQLPELKFFGQNRGLTMYEERF